MESLINGPRDGAQISTRMVVLSSFGCFFNEPGGSLTFGGKICPINHNLHNKKHVLLQNEGFGRFYFFKTTIFGGNNHRIWHAYFIALFRNSVRQIAFCRRFCPSEIQGAINREIAEAQFREHFEASFREHF